MFRVDEETVTGLSTENPTSSYVISPNDLLLVEVYTGKGEKLIDPSQQLIDNSRFIEPREIYYQVREDGTIDLPMVGIVFLSGNSLQQAVGLLKEKFSVYYKDPYVLIRFVNKRVVVLGATGTESEGKIIPLETDNVTVSEILAIAGGLTKESNAGNIRLIRGEQVKILDLTTFQGYTENNIIVRPGDIIYVEPVRRPFSEFMRENYGIFGLTTGIISLISLIISLK